MNIARVIGTIVATQKDEALETCKICVIQPLDAQLKPRGKPLIATDATASRGADELVYYVTGGDAVHTGLRGFPMPVDAAIVGIVDTMDADPGLLDRL
jgi:ethanolamine utilization protein EutN